MKHQFKITIACLYLFSAAGPMVAQDSQVFDTIAISNTFVEELTFRIDDPILKKVSFSKSHPKNTDLKGKHLFGDFGSSLLTLVSGIGIDNTKKDVRLKFSSRVKCQDSRLDWEIDLYCMGLLEKFRERYNDDEGSYSMNIDRTAYIDWEGGAAGIISKNDTKIGAFDLFVFPKFEEVASNDPLDFVNPPPAINEVEVSGDELPSKKKDIDYKIVGDIYGKGFSVKGNLKNKRFYVYHDDILKLVLQMAPTGRIVKERRNYALLDTEISPQEATYWLKIALYNAYLVDVVSKSRYNW